MREEMPLCKSEERGVLGTFWVGVDTERFNLDLIPTLCRRNSVRLGPQEIRGCYGMSI